MRKFLTGVLVLLALAATTATVIAAGGGGAGGGSAAVSQYRPPKCRKGYHHRHGPLTPCTKNRKHRHDCDRKGDDKRRHERHERHEKKRDCDRKHHRHR